VTTSSMLHTEEHLVPVLEEMLLKEN